MSTPVIERRGVRPVVGLLGLVAAVMAWQYLATSSDSPFIVPFTEALEGARELVAGDSLREDVIPSVMRAAIGFAIATFLGISIGGIIGYKRGIEPWVRPQLEFLRATPIPAILPVAILVIGPTDTMRVAIIVLGGIWPILLNTIDGVRSVDPRYVEAARIARYSEPQIIRKVVLKAAMPTIFAGLRVALALTLIIMVISEMIASKAGLGNYVLQAQRTFGMQKMYAGVLTLGVIGGIFTALFALVERNVLRWHVGRTRGAK